MLRWLKVEEGREGGRKTMSFYDKEGGSGGRITPPATAAAAV
jgi:hypothetical protein